MCARESSTGLSPSKPDGAVALELVSEELGLVSAVVCGALELVGGAALVSVPSLDPQPQARTARTATKKTLATNNMDRLFIPPPLRRAKLNVRSR
jgi:hypothetical protein